MITTNGGLILRVLSEIMCSWCMCVDGELVEWVVDDSGCLRIRWLFDGVAMMLLP